MKPVIIDDIVDKNTQDLIEQTVFGKETSWTFARSTFSDGHQEVTDIQKKNLMSFTKQLVDLSSGKIDADYDLYSRIIEGVEKSKNIRVRQVNNARIQLQLPLLTEKDKVYGMPHLDAHRSEHYYVLVYYVNDVDGDTVIYKQKKDNCTPKDIIDGKLDIDITIPPKKGRAVIFDGDVYHAVGKPKTDVRCIINFNFVL